jgi:hypothetical protein
MQVDKMIRETAPTRILFNFAQTASPGWLDMMTGYIYQTYRDYNLGQPQMLYGYGPSADDISETIRT